MGRPKGPRGRTAPRLPVIRVSPDELAWAELQVAERLERKPGYSLTKFVRDRVFAGMPGYRP